MKPKDLMGKVVIVTDEFRRYQDPDTGLITWETHEKRHGPRAGWIVGVRTIQDGRREFISEEEGSTFKQTAQKKCILVSYWPSMNPVRVPLDGYEMGEKEPYPPNWSPIDRAIYKEYHCSRKHFPRDSKGRFA